MHQHGAEPKSRALVISVVINVVLSVSEIIGGLLSGSLSLVADAVHNLSDAGALAVALIARKIAARKADERKTFGYQRAEVVGAVINLTALIIIAGFLIYEGVERVLNPAPVDGWTMVIVASIALIINLGTVFLLSKQGGSSLNIKAALLHNLSDAFASVGVIIAGAAALIFEVYFLDWVITFVIAGYVLFVGVKLLRQSAHILMEGVPEGLDIRDLEKTVASEEGVVSVHHIHAWQLDEDRRSMEAHIVLREKSWERMTVIKKSLKEKLEQAFQITHTSFEFETPDDSCA